MYALPPQFPRDPFRAGDADALGITAKMLVGRRFQRIVHGSHLLADVQVTAELILQALKRLRLEAVLSCMSAAKLYDRRLDASPGLTSVRRRTSGVPAWSRISGRA